MTLSETLGLCFTLSFALLLLLQVLTMDLLRAYGQMAKEIDAAIGHDTSVFPDYEPHP